MANIFVTITAANMAEGERMKNPLESLHMTIVMGLVLTVIMVLVVQAIGS